VTTLTPDEFKAAGLLLYGTQWAQPMAGALGIEPGRIAGWLLGRREIPNEMWLKVHALIVARVRALVDVGVVIGSEVSAAMVLDKAEALRHVGSSDDSVGAGDGGVDRSAGDRAEAS